MGKLSMLSKLFIMAATPVFMEGKALTNLSQADILPNDMEANYTMAFVKAVAPAYGSGLIFWAKDYNDYYALITSANGWITVQRWTSGRWLTPVAWRESDAIKKGEGAEN
jgi:hypothetical protein